MFNWDFIFTEAAQANTKLVYLGIGSAMGSYLTNSNNKRISDEKNQQFPPFLKKFEGKKIIILIDPELEEYLAVEQYMDEHDFKFEKYTIDNVRVLRNDEIIVYAIKETFNYIIDTSCTPQEIIESRTKVDWNISNLINLIGVCLEKRTNTKIILQDYTGRDTTIFYSRLFNIFDRTQLINNVMFDVTQKDGGCFIEMNEHQASIDSNGHFIQEKYMELVAITGSPLFKSILQERIQQVIYPLSYDFVSLKKNPTHEIINKKKLVGFAHSYNIQIDEFNNNSDYLIQKYEQIIQKIIEDIVKARSVDSSAIGDLMGVIDNHSTFSSSLMIFNFD
jgi:hypothetical protein